MHKSATPVAVIALATTFGLAACGQEQGIPYTDVGGPFWDEIDFAQVTDHGHEVRLLDESERIPAGPIELVDVTEQAGLAAAVGGGNQHGVGIGFVDLDGDELPDIFVANGIGNRTGEVFSSALYQNQGDGSFRDVTAESGVGAILAGRDCYSVTAGDYDHDGDMDLYIGAQPTDVLLRNCGQVGTPCFEDATEEAGAGGPPSDAGLVQDGRSKIASFGDYDNDGDLDIVSASKTLPAPYAYLLRNQGDGTFVDISEESGVHTHIDGNPCAVLWSDYDNDGDADIHIWNDRGGHVLLRNHDGQELEDVTRISGLDAVQITHPMGIDAADIDHDGDLDYYVSNIGDNPLLRNNGDGTFTDITQSAGTGGDYGWGLAFEDFDGDSYPDIFIGQEDDRPHLVFHNLANNDAPSFARMEFEHAPIIDNRAAHNVAVAFADYDLDGRVDVVAAPTDGSRITLYRNQTDVGSNQWLHVIVRDPDGVESTEGIGARVGVMTGGLLQFRDITGGSSRASQNQLGVRFGLGDYSGADWVAVLWPTGRQAIATRVAGGQTLVFGPE